MARRAIALEFGHFPGFIAHFGAHFGGSLPEEARMFAIEKLKVYDRALTSVASFPKQEPDPDLGSSQNRQSVRSSVRQSASAGMRNPRSPDLPWQQPDVLLTDPACTPGSAADLEPVVLRVQHLQLLAVGQRLEAG